MLKIRLHVEQRTPPFAWLPGWLTARRDKWVMICAGVEFTQYLESEGYHVIPIKREHQLQYACNVLNLGDSNILSCHPETARQIIRSPHFKGNVQLVEFGAITSMYGALHCSSQVVRRVPLAQARHPQHSTSSTAGGMGGGGAGGGGGGSSSSLLMRGGSNLFPARRKESSGLPSPR